MKLRLAATRSALLSLLSRPETKQHLRLTSQPAIALGMALLLLPLAQIDALAQQQYPQKPSPYPSQYAQPNPYGQQQYPQQSPDQQNYADQAPAPDQYNAGQSPDQSQDPSQQSDQGFASQQLEQLVAPIALYPDNLIAQILTAATYPAQVVAADNWLQSMGRVSPDQVAAAADAQATWDPSVKALTAFPQVLSMMDHDLQWTTDLGNAYYNQPQDVLSSIQVLRQRAQNAGTLQSTPQEQVTSDQGYIQLAPSNPEVVYVPTYNPWYAYGAPIDPYPGFYYADGFGRGYGSGIWFGAGIALGAFFHADYGWRGWGLNWHNSCINYHQQPYYSRSNSVARWGSFHGGYGGGNRAGFGGNYGGGNRPGFGGSYGGGRSIPNRPMPEGRAFGGNFAGNNRGESGYGRGANGNSGQQFGRENGGRAFGNSNPAYRGPASPGSNNFSANRSGNFGGNGLQAPAGNGNGRGNYAGNPSGNYGVDRTRTVPGNSPDNYASARPQYGSPMRQQFSAPQQQYSRPQTYAPPAYSAPQQQYSRPHAYAPPAYSSGGYRNQQSFANQRSYSAPAPVSRGYQQSAPRYEAPRSFGGGGGGNYHAPPAPSYHPPAAPRWNGGGGGGGGRSSGNGGGSFHNSDNGKHH